MKYLTEFAITFIMLILTVLVVMLFSKGAIGFSSKPDTQKYSWDNDTRKAWSTHLDKIMHEDMNIYASASDISKLCPKFNALNSDQKAQALSEFWIALALYESGWNPKDYSVDVGNKSDKGSWSVGLYQMSANDSAAKKYGASFESLKDPLVNITVATEQMRRQIDKCGAIFLDNKSKCRYWAVALHSNKFSKIPEIKARVLKYAPECK